MIYKTVTGARRIKGNVEREQSAETFQDKLKCKNRLESIVEGGNWIILWLVLNFAD